MRQNIAKITIMTLFVLPFAQALPAAAAAAPNWNAAGNYVVALNYLGTDYAHDMTLAQDGLGNLSGNGGYPAGGSHVYTWVLTSGLVSGNSIDFFANYTASADAVTPLTTMHATGTIATNGSISGTWSDNYQGGSRAGVWTTTSGTALPLGSLSAEDFGVVDYDTGLGQLRGYSAGFGLTDATFASSTSVVVQLFASTTLLQTNTGTPKIGNEISGAQISSPFDVSGTFDYVTDGYWTNVRESQYGQSLGATRVVATVTLANGKVVTAENTNLDGNPVLIFPSTTSPATVKVTIDKFIDGVQAATTTAHGLSFSMSATWAATSTGSGSGTFTLGPIGFNSTQPYEAVTADMTSGASYSTNEILDNVNVGSVCATGTPFALIGYSVGDTLQAATLAPATTTIPNFTLLTSDKYVIVQNHACPIAVPPSFSTVHILKYLDGQTATASTSNSYLFPMSATWMTANLNSGATTSGEYVLGTSFGGATNVYGADTAAMQAPANYTTSEITSNINPASKVVLVGGMCVVGNYRLLGYKSSSVSFADASTQPLTTTTPQYTGLLTDRYLLVLNETCTAPIVATGEISGTKFEDWDADKSPFEKKWEVALSGWTIYLDTNNNGVLDAGETSTTTNAKGNYHFTALAAGTYHVREVQKTGWIQITPSTGSYNVTLATTTSAKGKDFGNFKLGSISGMKWGDTNGNGRKDNNEVGLQGWTIQLIKVGSPTVIASSTITNATGNYSFTNIGPGTYRIREVAQTGWFQTTRNPSNVKINSDTTVKNANFGNHFGKVTKDNKSDNNRDDDDSNGHND